MTRGILLSWRGPTLFWPSGLAIVLLSLTNGSNTGSIPGVAGQPRIGHLALGFSGGL